MRLRVGAPLTLQQLPIQRNGAAMLAQARIGVGIQRLIVAVVRIVLAQQVEFSARIAVTVELDQDAGVFAPRQAVAGFHVQNRG